MRKRLSCQINHEFLLLGMNIHFVMSIFVKFQLATPLVESEISLNPLHKWWWTKRHDELHNYYKCRLQCCFLQNKKKEKRHTVPFIMVRDPVAHEFLFKQTNKTGGLDWWHLYSPPFNCPLNKRLNGAISLDGAGSWKRGLHAKLFLVPAGKRDSNAWTNYDSLRPPFFSTATTTTTRFQGICIKGKRTWEPIHNINI